jgi:hypothetical protein
MSSWETIEQAVITALDDLSLLETVAGRSTQDRKLLTAAMARERMPAAYVMVTGRAGSDKAYHRPGAPAIDVWLAARSHRHDDEARIGADDVTGIFELAEPAASALQDLTIGTNQSLLLIDERAIGGEDGLYIWQQRYEVRCRAETTAPTFGGVPLTGTESVVQVELGELQRASSCFSFPGIDGVFEHSLGVRERPIVWSGQLRAASDSALNFIESAIENEVRSGEAKSLVDAWGRTHDACTARTFRRRGPRQRDALSGEALQDFELTFVQLNT